MIKRDYYLFDAEKHVLGRMASKISRVLTGKGKPQYLPHIDSGDFAVVINAAKVRLTGNKFKNKIYYRYSGYPGGISKRSFTEQAEKDVTKIIKNAVYGMLPKNKLRDKMMKRLIVFPQNHNLKVKIKEVI